MKQRHKHHDDQDLVEDRPVRRVLAQRSSDMNVTPLIDVLLVLLVIFMATLPLMQRGFDIQLPLESKVVSTPEDTKQVVVQRTADGQVTLNKAPIPLTELESRLRELYANRRDKTVFVQGAESLKFGDVVPIIDAATAVGLRVAIITTGMQAIGQRPK